MTVFLDAVTGAYVPGMSNLGTLISLAVFLASAGMIIYSWKRGRFSADSIWSKVISTPAGLVLYVVAVGALSYVLNQIPTGVGLMSIVGFLLSIGFVGALGALGGVLLIDFFPGIFGK